MKTLKVNKNRNSSGEKGINKKSKGKESSNKI